MSVVTGMFRDEQSVNQALGALGNVGIRPGEVSLVLSQSALGRIGDDSRVTGASVLGDAVGAMAASLLAVGRIVFPPLGLVAAGPIVAALLGAGAGGLLGALAGTGVSEQQALLLEDGVSRGQILLAVHVGDGRASLVQEIVHSAGAHVEAAA